MIRWFCDICTKEIGDPRSKAIDNKHPQHLCVYTEGRNRNLEGCSGATYHIRLILCENCKRRLIDSFTQKVNDIKQYKAYEEGSEVKEDE